MNREAWLTQLAEGHIKPLFLEHDGQWPEHYRLSVGFPKGSRGGRKSIGQCWDNSTSADKANEMFISPELDPFDSAHVTVHELIHASVGIKAGHKAPFKKLAVAVGLTGKMTATVPGEALTARIKGWLEKMPAFPGAVLDPSQRAGGGPKPGSRLLKVVCPDCEYTVRTTGKWIEVGMPRCPCGTDMILG